MFNYYDERLKTRLNNLKRKSTKNFDLLKAIEELTKSTFKFVKWVEDERDIRAPQNMKAELDRRRKEEDDKIREI